MGRLGFFDDARGNSDGGGVGGDILEDDGVCADFGVVAYGDVAEDFCACADVYVAAEGGVAGEFAAVAYGDLLIEEAVWADF